MDKKAHIYLRRIRSRKHDLREDMGIIRAKKRLSRGEVFGFSYKGRWVRAQVLRSLVLQREPSVEPILVVFGTELCNISLRAYRRTLAARRRTRSSSHRSNSISDPPPTITP